MTNRINFFFNCLFYFLVFFKFPFLLLFLFSMFCFQVNLFPVLCAFLTFSPAFQFPHFPFPPSYIHMYLEKHYNIKVLLNNRIRSTVWLQLTLVPVKPFYFLKITIGDAENIQGHLWKPLLQCKWAEAQFLWMQHQPLPAQTAAQMASYEIGVLDYWVHVFSAEIEERHILLQSWVGVFSIK